MSDEDLEFILPKKQYEINYKEFRKTLLDFKRYYDGYTRHEAYAHDELLKMFAKLEEVVFGEQKSNCWQC